MFHNIVLLDRGGDYIEEIHNKYPTASIFLVSEKCQKVENLLAKYSNYILLFIDYNNLPEAQDIESIDYEIIKKMKSIQIDIETMLHRVIFNNPLAKDIYYQHLSLFVKIFKNHQIDLILCTEYNLATPNHLIPFGLGKLLGIPTYAVEHLPSCAAASLNNYNNSERVVFYKPYKNLSINNLIFYQHRSLQNPPKNLKERLYKLLGAMFIEFAKCILERRFHRKYLGMSYSYWKKLYSLFLLKKLKKAYKKYSIKPDYNAKYIYYSIHMEPEATIIGKTILDSQLTMIKMIAHALPKNWKLYVKEHPHQFMLNTSLTHYFLHNITFFKNLEFYQEIQKLNNTYLISIDAQTPLLIKNSQAIATVNGTVTLEAMLANKYAILFSGKSGLYGILGNTIHITSFEELKKAIEKISLCAEKKFSHQNEMNILRKFVIDREDSDFYHNLFKTIEDHSKTIKPTGETL